MVIWRLLDGPRRYSELSRAISDVGERALSHALKELNDDGVVLREGGVWKLTPQGRALEQPMRGLFDWGCRHGEVLPWPEDTPNS